MEIVTAFLLGLPLMYFGLFLFACVWWYCCKWFLVGLVIIGEKIFKKDTWPYNIFMFTFVGGGGLATIYLFIYLFLSIAKGEWLSLSL
ncbi:hypothetical protein N9Y53_03270 [Candidatus Pelagibacter bacterium]|jgi:hypothetical protein|nr:hypothetical protein [Candidatus Pelagibacter bacterium]